ncbi:MAG: tail fiber domain-containing protein, partial [Azonexus sp.]
VDGTTGATDMPTRLEFQVQADGAGGWLGDGGSTPEMVIKNTGLVGFGTAAPWAALHVVRSGSEAGLALESSSATVADSSYIWGSRSRGTAAAPTIVQANDEIFELSGIGYDGSANRGAGKITLLVDGTPGANDMPARWEFATTPDGSTTMTTRMTIKNTGDIGMGTTAPASKLHVADVPGDGGVTIENWVADSNSPNLNFLKARGGSEGAKAIVQANDELGHIMFNGYDGTNHEYGAFIVANVDGTPGNNDMPGRMVFWTTPDGSATPAVRMIIKNDGNVAIGNITPNVALDVNGDIEYTGTIADVSDIRLKTNILPLINRGSMLEKLGQVDTYSFTMKDDKKGQVEFGVMAQEIEKIFPELVRTADDEMGTKSVNYTGLIAPMIEAGKELEAQNKAMKAEIDALKAQQDEMKQAMNDIAEDMKGLKVHTGYGISKAQMGLLMMLAAFGALSGAAAMRRRSGRPRQ